jgi:hypothetical protein
VRAPAALAQAAQSGHADVVTVFLVSSLATSVLDLPSNSDAGR